MSKTHFTEGDWVRYDAGSDRLIGCVSVCGLPTPAQVTHDPNLVDCQRCDQILIKRALDRVMKEVQEETANA